MTRVIFVRHGQTRWNSEMRYQGHTDLSLSEQGLRQAELVAQRLAAESVSAIYASDLNRAFTTAQIIAAKHGLPVIPVPDLREIRFGEWEGLTYKSIDEKWPGTFKKLFTCPDKVEIPGGESFAQLRDRAEKSINRLVADHPDQTIIVVSHGGTIRTLLCAALDIKLARLWNIKQDNTAVSIIEYFPDRAVIALVNDSHHLVGCDKI